ncbi:hypothetical protein [Wolbachia endosymbiont of Cantharis cryptica]|uniref:hypothetical protein n=1 Tax=Wolbachia endosymbiont of Cantharis cryptica TaxID=3066132 RepID=UPI00376F2ED2
MLLQCLPIFDVQGIERREGYPFYTNEVIYEQPCEDLSSMRSKVNIDQKQIKHALNDIKIGHYLEFSFSCYTYNKKNNTDNTHYSSGEESDSSDSIDSNDYDEGTAHSTLVYKAENSKYIFFDPNKGAVGFCPNTGIANLTPKEICRILELAINFYSYDKYIENSPIFPDGCEIFITLRNATLMLEKAGKFYETAKNINSKVMDISVDRNTGNLSFTPVLS